MRSQSMPPTYSGPPVRRPRRRQPLDAALVWGWLGITFGLLLITGALAFQAGRASVSQAANQSNPGATTASTQAPQTWTTIQTFTGKSNKKTATFTVPSDWKIVWTCTPAQNSPNNLAILVYSADNTLLDGALDTICQKGQTGDTTEEHQGGQVYLDVTAFEPWTIKVQVLQ